MNTRKKNILIVEDSATQAIMLEAVLEAEGFVTKIARSGEMALELIEEFQPGIVISDVIMPGLTGYDLCRKIKENEKTKTIPVILLTSLSDPYDVIKGLQCGADNFITKPYRNDFLLSRIQYILINQELRANAMQDESGIQFFFAGEKLSITSNRIQIVDLLFSSFENAIQKNDELKEVNHELEATQEKLQEAIKEANKANMAKGEFLAAMSHDIRTPMNGIVGMIQLLKETNLSLEQLDYLDTVDQSADSLLALINDILDFSKIDAGHLDLTPESFDLWDYVEKNLKAFSIRAEEIGLELVCEIDRDVPRVICTDHHRLGQILTNLVGNSIKFTTSGSIKVKVSEVSRDDEIVELLFCVEDSGCGISETELRGIFDPFSQIKDSGNTFRKGTGLGLSICSRLSQLLGGEIGVESELGKGSQFSFTIKAPIVEENTLSTEIFNEDKVLLYSLSHHTQDIITKALTPLVGSLTVRENEDEIRSELSNAANAKEPFRVVLIDTHLGEEKAFDLIQGIQASYPEIKTLPLLGSIHFKETKALCERMKMPVTLTRPFHGGTLVTRMLELLEEHSPSTDEIGKTKEKKTSRKLKILIAEDNRVNQSLMDKVMKRLEHEFSIVDNGQEAVDALEKEDYDLVLMDLKMPVLDGVAATHQIRASEKVLNKSVPIVALTANAMKGDREECLKNGMDGYLSKPIRIKELEELLDTLSE